MLEHVHSSFTINEQQFSLWLISTIKLIGHLNTLAPNSTQKFTTSHLTKMPLFKLISIMSAIDQHWSRICSILRVPRMFTLLTTFFLFPKVNLDKNCCFFFSRCCVYSLSIVFYYLDCSSNICHTCVSYNLN